MTDWVDDAKCNGSPQADLFFDDEKETRLKMANTFCSNCPVKYECLSSALQGSERFGVWGGVDEDSIREVQHIDRLGKPATGNINKVTCTFCETEIPIKSKVSQEITCPTCALQWRVEFK